MFRPFAARSFAILLFELGFPWHLGCQTATKRFKVKAEELEQRPEGFTLVRVNGSLFPAKADLTNNPGR
jgi:hypothetical protein